ncbi:MAG TPA: T9SS type A sorting domain-containing protein [Chitinophagaceae bacterium]|nr:T9SS type A sorting domain-containing protein [Chitinophagaceae bacterium]
MKYLIYCPLVFLLCLNALYSQVNEAIQFIENKGQWDESILFKGDMGGNSFYIRSDGFSVLMRNADDYLALSQLPHNSTKKNQRLLKLRSHLYKVSFVNTLGKIKITGEKMQPYYTNYFYGSDQSKWAGGCRVYLGLTVKNIYPGIDARYYSEKGQLKYDLLITPGADHRQIKLRYEGAEELSIINNQLVIKTSVGEVKELYPYSYQLINNQKRSVTCRYQVNQHEVSFDLANYSKSEQLVIDPSLVFSTLTGSTADNWGFCSTYGKNGEFYSGSTSLNMGFPVSPGAYDETFNGGNPSIPSDISIFKFTADGTNRIYATYIGGSGSEQPASLIEDAQGNLIIYGNTNSGFGNSGFGNSGFGSYPAINTYGSLGATDIIVTKLNSTGTALVGSMRIGGSGSDGVNIEERKQFASLLKQNYGDDAKGEVILDDNGNILIATCTQSANFPVSGNFQSNLSGTQDGAIIKLNGDATAVTWSTYIGESGYDVLYGLTIDPITKKIYLCGGTTSAVFPGVGAGVLQTTNAGGTCDGFVSIVTDNGNSVSLNRSTFIGTSGNDQAYLIKTDGLGFPYITGQTTGVWGIVNAPYNVPNSRQFIAKLKPDLSAFIYSTCFGVSESAYPNFIPTAFYIDNVENVYLAGWGSSHVAQAEGFYSSGVVGLPVTADAIKNTTNGSDFYLFVMEANAASLLYGSFFGEDENQNSFGDHTDGGMCRFDNDGVLYLTICANCGVRPKATFPVTNGVWSSVNGAGDGCNTAAVKINLKVTGTTTGIRDFINDKRITVLPNPVKDRLQIVNAINDKKLSLVIRDISGKVLYKKEAFKNNLEINVSNLGKAIYLVEIRDASQQLLFRKKIIKQ